jgi:hypothetical protein
MRAMVLRLVAYGLVALATSLLPCANAYAQRQLLKIVTAGHDVLVDGYARADNNCQGIDPPQIMIEQPPEHGTVCFRRDDLVLRTTMENNLVHCLGRKVSGFSVIYLSRRDYKGADRFRYTVRFPTVEHSIDVTLNVLPEWRASLMAVPADVSAAAGETRQRAGPIPACTALVS